MGGFDLAQGVVWSCDAESLARLPSIADERHLLIAQLLAELPISVETQIVLQLMQPDAAK